MTVNLPAQLPDIEEIERGFNRSVELYAEAFDKIAEADAAVKRAQAEIERVTPGAHFHSDRDGREIKEFHEAIQLPDRYTYGNVARKLLTLRCWHYVIDRCGMQQLMDAQAKKEFDAQLRYVPERPKRDRHEVIDQDEVAKGPPPFTADNVRGTLDHFAGQAGMIWRRGIANAFSSLDRRFRSHDGFKVGSRVILTYFANQHGSVDTYGASSEVFRDIERTFHILDGRDPRHARSDFLHSINQERREIRPFHDPKQSVHENQYFRVRIFMNGNAHLWFTRDDLVDKVNLELAAYYGEVIGDGQTKEDDPLESRALTPARLFGFYPTPHELAERIVAHGRYSEVPMRILEPSAGTGNLAFLAAAGREVTVKDEWSEMLHRRVRETKQVRNVVDAIEIQSDLAIALRSTGLLNSVTTGDFLKMEPRAIYDGVIMNPPFDRERDIDHVTHAMKFLKPDGFLLSIMSAGVEFRETRKAAAFRKLLDSKGGWMIDLPAGSFSDVGTYVNTVLVGFGTGRAPHRF